MPSRKNPPPPRAYHHGQLREALIAATEAILAEGGVEALTLRAVARRAGVSPAAPAHHFASLKGLLTAVATLGFEALAAELAAGNARGGDDAVRRLREQGRGYVRFALAHPGRFRLMFRRERLNHDDPALRQAAGRAFRLLEDGVRAVEGLAAGAPLEESGRSLLLLAWSGVHGFAELALAGQFDAMAGRRSAAAFAETALPAMLEAMLPQR